MTLDDCKELIAYFSESLAEYGVELPDDSSFTSKDWLEACHQIHAAALLPLAAQAIRLKQADETLAAAIVSISMKHADDSEYAMFELLKAIRRFLEETGCKRSITALQ